MKSISAGTVTVIMMAVLFGLVAAYAVRSYLAKPEPETVDVWVAAINLPKYSRITANNMRGIPTELDKIPTDAILEPGRVVGRLVAETIEAGQPVHEAQLFPIDEEPAMADQVPPGMRAVTISVNELTALSGVLLPDSLVDISLTAETDHPDVDEKVTVTLVSGVKVLATSQQRHRFSENSPRPLRTITVAATPQQANKLILAQQFGQLHVTLRSSLDAPQTVSLVKDSDEDDAIDRYDLLGLDAPKPPIASQIWRGTAMTEVRFGQGEIAESRRATPAVEMRRAKRSEDVGAVKRASYGFLGEL